MKYDAVIIGFGKGGKTLAGPKQERVLLLLRKIQTCTAEHV